MQYIRAALATVTAICLGHTALADTNDRALGIVHAPARRALPVHAPLSVTSSYRESRTAQPTTAVAGEQKFIVLLVSFPSMPLLSQVTPQLLQSTYFGASQSVDSYLREVSYGKASASGSVYGPFVLDADYFGQPEAARDAAVRIAAAHIDFTQYNRIVLVVPQSSAGLESGGLGTIGSETVSLPNGSSITASTTWLGDASAASPTDLLYAACHELGHNLGLQHARAADFGSEPVGPTGQVPVPFDAIHEYGDSYSNMGRYGGHWAASQKYALGWLQDGTDKQDVNSNGTYLLQPYEASNDGLKVLRVQRGSNSNDWLWIEYRQTNIGTVDSALPANAFSGALIHDDDAGWGDTTLHSNLLRFTPDSTAGGVFFGNPALAAGSTWVDPYSNLSISLGKDVSKGLQVTVNYAPAPGYSLAASTPDIAATGGTLAVNVNAPASFAWAASSSASWLSITAGGSGTGNGAIQVAAAPAVDTNARWARIIVGAASAVVTQDPISGALTLSPYITNFPANGGAGTIAVNANAPSYSWSENPSDSWIQSIFFNSLLLEGSGTLSYVVAQNDTPSARTGTISIGNQTFTITQAAGSAQVSKQAWNQLTIGNAPISRMSFDSDYDSDTGETILYGGNWDTTILNDTWGWNGTSWTQKTPAHTPGNRTEHAMAWDAAHHQLVMFGGYDPALPGYSNATWIWNGSDWTQVFPANSPSARAGHSMVYDPDRQVIVLFGGNDNEADTWEWDGSNWYKITTFNAPPPREGASLSYDAAHKVVVLFGGYEGVYPIPTPTWYNDTWTWDGAQWRQMTPTQSPSPREFARTQYSPALGQVVLVGGYNIIPMASNPTSSMEQYHEETWTWNGSNWTQQFPDQSMPFSWNYGMTYDPKQNAFVTFLGDDLHCASRGPHAYQLTPGSGATLLNAYRADIPAAGASGSVNITASTPWAASADGWISLGATTSGSGNGAIAYQVAPYTSATQLNRTGQITINDKAITISQNSTVADQYDCLFNWAEANYPSALAPAGQTSHVAGAFYFRYYRTLSAYLGISTADGHLYYYDPAVSPTLSDLGTAAGWLSKAACH